jgi:two-component system response regulator MprA
MSGTAAPSEPVVVVVDDDADIRGMLDFALATAGWRVVGAADGQEALDQLRGGLRPCVVLLDLTMPRMSGSQFLSALRADPSLADTAVVVLSGDGNVSQKANALGTAGYLRKPLDLDTLYDTVRRFCP